MRKNIALFLLVCLVLTSCNFPLSKPTPDQAVVATRIALTFAASIPSPLPQNPTQALPTVALNTLEPSATPTIIPTATNLPGDPKLTLGTPDFSDTFTSATAFGLAQPYVDDAVLIKVEGGAMQFISLQINGGKRWRLSSYYPQNFYLEGSFRTISCSEDDQYGLVFRAPTYSDGIGYYFGVTCNGKYFLQRYDGADLINVVGLTADSNIASGSNQVNNLGIMATGTNIKIYINGNLIKEVDDTEGINDKGYTGAYSAAYDDPGFTVYLEDISVWNLP